MALDAIQKAKFQEIKLKRMYEKRAKVTIKDFEIFRLNLVFLTIGLILIIIGILVVAFLLPTANGKNAISDLSSSDFSSSSGVYRAYVGAHFGSVSIGTGIFKGMFPDFWRKLAVLGPTVVTVRFSPKNRSD